MPYLIISAKTGRPYVSPARTSIAYDMEEEAEEFCEDHGLALSAVDDELDTATQCYAAGADELIYRGEEDRHVMLSPEYVKRGFYNRRLTYDLNAFRHDRTPENFYDLAMCKYIVASKISKEKPLISFAVVRAESRFTYLAFSSLDTYTDWAAKAPGWSPVLVDFDSLIRICGEHGFLLDPFTGRYSVSREKCREIKEHAKKLKKEGGA